MPLYNYSLLNFLFLKIQVSSIFQLVSCRATLHFQLDSYDNLEGTLNRTRELDYNRAGGI